MSKLIWKLCLLVIVLSHHIGLWTITMSVPLLLFNEPIWISLPLCAWIMHLALNRLDCPYTRLENYLNSSLGPYPLRDKITLTPPKEIASTAKIDTWLSLLAILKNKNPRMFKEILNYFLSFFLANFLTPFF